MGYATDNITVDIEMISVHKTCGAREIEFEKFIFGLFSFQALMNELHIFVAIVIANKSTIQFGLPIVRQT